ncbi:MAG: hypothetical protein ABIR08_11850 [Sphingomonas sp.]
MTDYLIFFTIVLGVNLLPAFRPPTWSIIVLYGLNTRLPVPGLVLTGALAAASGRFLLAHAFRLLANRLPDKVKRNLAAAREALLRRKRNAVVGLALFAISPLPSAQLFEAAGLAKVRLLPFTVAFFAGRVVSYSIYAMSAHRLRETSLGDVFRRNLTSPWGIALQLVMLGGLVALSQIDWERHFKRPPQ